MIVKMDKAKIVFNCPKLLPGKKSPFVLAKPRFTDSIEKSKKNQK